jgi:hypothetical protein
MAMVRRVREIGTSGVGTTPGLGGLNPVEDRGVDL